MNNQPLMKCLSCDSFVEGNCTLNPVHIQVPETHFCGQWSNKSINRVSRGASKKVSEEQVFREFCLLPEAGLAIELKMAIRLMAQKFAVDRRTIEDRLNSLKVLGYVEIFEREDDKKEVIRYALPEGEADEVRPREWIPLDDTPEIQSGRRRKWNWSDVAIVLEAGKDYRFSDMAALVPEITRGPFARIVLEAKANKFLTQNENGSYRLAG